MIMEAIKEHPHTIKYIKNLTDDIILEAIKINHLVIKYINNPTDEMKKVASEHIIPAYNICD